MKYCIRENITYYIKLTVMASKIKYFNFTHSMIRRTMTDKPYYSTISHSKVLGNMEMENKMSKEEG
jgi:hypothetical protein